MVWKLFSNGREAIVEVERGRWELFCPTDMHGMLPEAAYHADRQKSSAENITLDIGSSTLLVSFGHYVEDLSKLGFAGLLKEFFVLYAPALPVTKFGEAAGV